MCTRQYPFRRKIKWFTLVELIVVITILAILGSIGFLAIGGYSSKARDSARIGDIAQVSKSLDLAIVTSGSYPLPDNSFAVTYSGGTVWNQGTIGPLVMQYFKATIPGGGLGTKPVDPLKHSEYTYSTLAEGKAYQIKAECEGDMNQAAMNGNLLVESAFAAEGDPATAYIRGNFGGLTAKTTTGSSVYVLAIPSIVTNSGTTNGAPVPVASLSGTLLFNGKALRNASGFNPAQVVFSWAKLPSTDSEISSMMTMLQNAYSWSDLRSDRNIATLVSLSSGSLATYGTSMLVGHLGGTSTVSPLIVPVASGYISGNDTTWRNWADGTYATSCFSYKNPSAPKLYTGDTGDGVYWINPTGTSSFKAYCDMTSDGGGWSLAFKITNGNMGAACYNNSNGCNLSSIVNKTFGTSGRMSTADLNAISSRTNSVLKLVRSDQSASDWYHRTSGKTWPTDLRMNSGWSCAGSFLCTVYSTLNNAETNAAGTDVSWYFDGTQYLPTAYSNFWQRFGYSTYSTENWMRFDISGAWSYDNQSGIIWIK